MINAYSILKSFSYLLNLPLLCNKAIHNYFVAKEDENSLQNDKIGHNKIGVTSGTSNPSLWTNDLFGWVKSSVGGFGVALPIETPNTTTKLQVDAPMDISGIIMLLDAPVRKVTGQKYISTVDQSVSSLEAQGYALNIIEEFEKVVEQAGLKSGVSMHRLSIDFVEVQKEVKRKIMSGRFNEIPGVLSSYVEKVCPDREAGCSGRSSSKKLDKFMLEFNSRINVVPSQPIQSMLYNGSEVSDEKVNSGPKSYLNNSFVQGHLAQNKVKLIS